MSQEFHEKALNYHRGRKPGKIYVSSHKSINTHQGLSLAYTPGVAAPVREILKNPNTINEYTIKGNLVAVITDGSAVLGLGNTGPLAAKPVMEGKAVLFKRFADIDVFDIELDTQDVDEIVNTIKNIAPTFGGINLEDISAPRCFEIEQRLIDELDIPVFHDDQHGTAIIVAAGLLNALEIQGKTPNIVQVVCAGAGSAGIAILNLLTELGVKRENMLLVDRSGVISKDKKKKVNKYKATFAVDTKKKTLHDAMKGADIFIGVARGNLVTKEMVKSMAEKPIIFALSNPDPEISPVDAFSCRSDILMATGRSDYPNQINNVLCFPGIFRGALDCLAKGINEDMKMAAARAIADCVPQEHLQPEYIIPSALNREVVKVVSKAVIQSARKTGMARKRGRKIF